MEIPEWEIPLTFNLAAAHLKIARENFNFTKPRANRYHLHHKYSEPVSQPESINQANVHRTMTVLRPPHRGFDAALAPQICKRSIPSHRMRNFREEYSPQLHRQQLTEESSREEIAQVVGDG